MTARKKRAVRDWEKIELDYRAGIKTLRQIGDEHGISAPAILKRARRDGWERDLSARIRNSADAEVNRRLVNDRVNGGTTVSEREVIEANASAIVEVRIGQRTDIQRSRRIVMALLTELEQETGAENIALLEKLGELLRCEDDKGQDKLNDLYHKVISLPGRAKTMKDLGETLRVLVGLERQAFNIDEEGAGGGDYEDRLRALYKEGA